jgi:hypothetical protein
MPKKELTDFQLELLQKKRNKDRVKQEQDLRKRVFALGVESNKERQLRIAVAKANRVIAADIDRIRGVVSTDESDDEDLDSNSSNDVGTVSSLDSDTQTDPQAASTSDRDQLIEFYARERRLTHVLILALSLVIVLLAVLLQLLSSRRRRSHAMRTRGKHCTSRAYLLRRINGKRHQQPDWSQHRSSDCHP